jgi:GNAT superfamily N-acetyltransferase
MLKLERSISAIHWVPIYNELCAAITNKHARKVSANTICVQSEFERTYALTISEDGIKYPVSWLKLWREQGWFAWEVIHVFTLNDFRGRGFARKLYKAAINNDRIDVLSGVTQSKWSRGLWESFAKHNDFLLYAIDLKDESSVCQVFWENDELQSELQLYHQPSSKIDVRIVAERKMK